MRCKPSIQFKGGRQEGLTIVEILVASALMVFIVFGLLIMFNQTQRAFKSSIRQVDVLEGGRAVLDLVVRDLEQLSTPRIPNVTTFHSTVDRTKGVDQYEGA